MSEDKVNETTIEAEEVTEEVTEEVAEPAVEEPSHISYEDFAKLEIKLGTIVTAEIVEDADKLLKLTVDVGEEEKRQIVSGIREYFPEPEVLIGRQCPFLVNLEPRTIRGLESQGMILAAGDKESFTLLHPEHIQSPGTGIR